MQFTTTDRSKLEVSTGFEECTGITRFFMEAIGVWPLDNPKSWKTRCKFLLPGVLILFFNIIPQTGKVIQDRHDLNSMLEVLTTVDIAEGMVLLKLFSMWFNRIGMMIFDSDSIFFAICDGLISTEKGLKKLVREIARDWNNTSTEEQQVMWSYAKLSKWAAICCYSLTTGSVLAQLFVFLMTSRSAYQNSSIDKPFYLKAYFPFDTSYSPMYEIICVCQCGGAFLSCAAFSSFDGFFVCSILHFSGQLYNLKHRFRNLITKHNMDTIGFTKSLRLAVLRHQRLVSYTGIIENSFSQTFLLQVIATSVVLCLQGYQFVILISESGTELLASLIFIVVFTICNIVSLFFYCYVAQIIRGQSEDLFYAIYEMRWYEVASKDAVLLVIIMSRCKTPIGITVGKFAVFSLEYFTTVMKTSMGYLSVLLAVRKKLT